MKWCTYLNDRTLAYQASLPPLHHPPSGMSVYFSAYTWVWWQAFHIFFIYIYKEMCNECTSALGSWSVPLCSWKNITEKVFSWNNHRLIELVIILLWELTNRISIHHLPHHTDTCLWASSCNAFLYYLVHPQAIMWFRSQWWPADELYYG